MIIQVIGAFFAVLTFSVVVGAPKKYLLYSGLMGAVGWLVYLLILRDDLANEIFAMFLASLTVALIAHSFARLFKAPVTVFLIPGILPMVPGLGMYRIVYYMIQKDTSLSSYYFMQTLQIAGVIAIAIFIMDTIFRLFQKRTA